VAAVGGLSRLVAPSEVAGPAQQAGANAASSASSGAAAAHQGLAFLRLSSDCSPSMSVERLVYLDKDEVTFGRMPSNHVTLDSQRVPQMISRTHGRLCRLKEDGKPFEWILHDNKSMNGILVNGQAIGEDGRRLQQGDIITFGRKMSPPEFEFVFEEPLQAQPLSAPTGAVQGDEPQFDPVMEGIMQEAFAEHQRRIAELSEELEAERACKIMESQQRAAQRSALDLEDIQSELLCSICQDWVVHAATIECSHTFCWSCVDTWLLQKKFECPVCRHVVTREPVRSRAIDAIVQKTVDKSDEKEDYRTRVCAAEKELKKVERLQKELEKSVNKALKKGKAFFQIDASWSRRERETFNRGVKDYTGETRETYCRLTNLTVQWVHSADDSKLNQALHNLGLADFVNSPEADIRKRLLMFLRYG
jgi:pSer/pThr/pTyr-binding forkhead associated (FHA) protein